MDLLKSIHELEDLVEQASRLPFTGKCMIPEDELMNLITDMRNQWPSALREAESITQERDKIIEDAHAEAQNIIEQAKAYAQKKVSDSEITAAAKARANEILEKTYQHSEEVRGGSMQYAEQILDHMDSYMRRMAESIAEAREGLKHIEDEPEPQQDESVKEDMKKNKQ